MYTLFLWVPHEDVGLLSIVYLNILPLQCCCAYSIFELIMPTNSVAASLLVLHGQQVAWMTPLMVKWLELCHSRHANHCDTMWMESPVDRKFWVYWMEHWVETLRYIKCALNAGLTLVLQLVKNSFLSKMAICVQCVLCYILEKKFCFSCLCGLVGVSSTSSQWLEVNNWFLFTPE